MQWLMFVLGCGEKDLDTGVEDPIEDTSPEEEPEEDTDTDTEDPDTSTWMSQQSIPLKTFNRLFETVTLEDVIVSSPANNTGFILPLRMAVHTLGCLSTTILMRLSLSTFKGYLNDYG